MIRWVWFWKVRGCQGVESGRSPLRDRQKPDTETNQLLTRALSESDSAPRGDSRLVYTDQLITCVDCGNQFTFTAGEQEFYEQKGFQNKPSRCPNCRQARKASRMGGGAGGCGGSSYAGGRGDA